MPPYSQLRGPIAWSLFGLTLLLSGFQLILMLLAVFLNRVFARLLGPETPPPGIPTKLWVMLGIGFAATILSLWLSRFYYVAARKSASSLYLAFGWAVSALYYGAITGLIVPFSPSSTLTFGALQMRMPTILVTGVASAASLYLLMALRRSAHAPAPPDLRKFGEESV